MTIVGVFIFTFFVGTVRDVWASGDWRGLLSLKVFFSVAHDPTQFNFQGPDYGTQYRSAIFYTGEAQRLAAEEAKAAAEGSGRWSSPVVTEIVPAGPFHPAEAFHQDYLERNPGGYTCHYLRD